MTRGNAFGVGLSASLLLAAGLGCQSAQRKNQDHAMTTPIETGWIQKSLDLEGETYRYAVYVPADYSPQRRWPVVVFLNGAGERGVDGVRQTEVGLGPVIRAHPERFPCLVVMPQCRPDVTWRDQSMTALAMACLSATEADYAVDPDRVTLTGLSLGGFGTWWMGAMYPDRFCALAPVCGGGDPDNADKLARTPIWCYHGEADPVVPVERSREMVEAVRAAGGDVRYTELPGVGHNSWDDAYGNPEYVAWMLAQRR